MIKNKNKLKILFAAIMIFSCAVGYAELGDRASWLHGALGLNWKPQYYGDGITEIGDGWMSIEPFLAQIEDFDTVDYIQLHLTESGYICQNHSSPHPVLEAMMGDVLIVPRAASGEDPFGDWLVACKAQGLRTMVYVNTGCVVFGNATIKERWIDYCDTNTEAQDYINSQSYITKSYDSATGDYTDDSHEERPYMFAYGELVLKSYSERYGDLIDAWLFDSANNIPNCGDYASASIEYQTLFQAWADACRAGNPNAAVAFNHGVGDDDFPFNHTTQVADFTFGHPAGGNSNPTGTTALYNKNKTYCQIMHDTGGFIYEGDDEDWNDRILGHYDPKMSTTKWNHGGTASLTDEEFLEWNELGLSGGAISWGVALQMPDCNNDTAPNLTANDWVIRQLQYLEDNLTVSREKYVQLRKRNAMNYCINGIGAANANNVRLYTYSTSNDNLIWEEIDRGNGYYSYRKKGTDYCIDGGNGGANNQNVYLWKQGANNYNQHWSKVNVGDGCVKLVKRNAAGYAINGGNSGAVDQNVNLWNSGHSSQNLQWFIEYK
jgi:hypothetical protein